MKKALYKSMYGKIQLEEGQKREILKELDKNRETGKRRKSLLVYAAACLCVVFMSNAAVFAAVHFNLGDKLARELDRFFWTERNLTEQQREIYAQHAVGLEQAVQLEHGTLLIDAVLCDNSYLFVPYTLCPAEPEKKQIAALWSEVKRLEFTLKGMESEMLTRYHVTSGRQEEGAFHGEFMLTGSFRQDDVVQVWPKKEGDVGKLEAPVCELAVSAIAASRNVRFHASEVNEKIGAVVENITLSSLSLQINGTYQNKNRDPGFIWYSFVELKDGTLLKEAPTGSSYSSGIETDETGISRFKLYQVFESPVALDEIKGIHLRTRDGSEYWIPFETD